MTAHNEPSRTLVASNPWQRLVWSNGAKRPRTFTPREWARLQGFPVIRHVARPLIAHLAQTTWQPECLFCAQAVGE